MDSYAYGIGDGQQMPWENGEKPVSMMYEGEPTWEPGTELGPSEEGAFDPSRYLTQVSGRDYLEVKWRLVWFRKEHPNGTIETQLVEHRYGEYAVFKATIKTQDGAIAVGHGSEIPSDFRDYVEKAETKALGRALAALGYGTQNCDDFDFGASEGRVVDSPIDRGMQANRAAAVNRPQQNNYNNSTPQASPNKPASDRQLKYIKELAAERGVDIDTTGMTSADASKVIEKLKAS